MPKFYPKKPFTLIREGEHRGNPNKNSAFLDTISREHINMGGVPFHVYRLQGTFQQDRNAIGVKHEESGVTKSPQSIGTFLGVQDTVLGENRDRQYDLDEVPVLRGAFQVSQNELEYAKYGLALANDIVTAEFHATTMEQMLGRRIVPGDVVEISVLREVGLDGRFASKWYEATSVVWSPTGYDAHFVRHILGVTFRPLRHQQEFLDILENHRDEYGKTLAEQASVEQSMMAITEQNQQMATEQVGVTGRDISMMWWDPTSGDKKPFLWTDDGRPPNGEPVPSGLAFPGDVTEGEYFLRIDMVPNRLYRFQKGRWRTQEVDRKREWGRYNWTEAMNGFLTNLDQDGNRKPYELRSVHDILTDREYRSDPTYSNDAKDMIGKKR